MREGPADIGYSQSVRPLDKDRGPNFRPRFLHLCEAIRRKYLKCRPIHDVRGNPLRASNWMPESGESRAADVPSLCGDTSKQVKTLDSVNTRLSGPRAESRSDSLQPRKTQRFLALQRPANWSDHNGCADLSECAVLSVSSIAAQIYPRSLRGSLFLKESI